ncbi:hypothetical protein LLEC1_03342 [Akanthomyces lecanii]|uniref:CMP/dCMP-type deaminase domain-containing protein n=1 Tax=Cordyceps confragosa TaxID=2714763 RepID=A0A179IK42_CORDF|nr:hypothetical protein LLEC1_03342 [Akanthomyces lecanii]
MIPSPFALGAALITSIVAVQYAHAADSLQKTLAQPARAINGIAPTTRSHWMRRANQALADVLGTPCPFAAFGTAIVNHTGNGLGDLICIGANGNSRTGNPTFHGEMAAIQNCTSILTDPQGPYNLTAAESLSAFAQLSLYTNAESCPMCAAAIRWAGFKEYVYGSSVDRLVEQGWAQIRISSMDVFRQSFDLPSTTRLIGEVLTNETDPYFLWQYDPEYRCPSTCVRRDGVCSKAH